MPSFAPKEAVMEDVRSRQPARITRFLLLGFERSALSAVPVDCEFECVSVARLQGYDFSNDGVSSWCVIVRNTLPNTQSICRYYERVGAWLVRGAATEDLCSRLIVRYAPHGVEPPDARVPVAKATESLSAAATSGAVKPADPEVDPRPHRKPMVCVLDTNGDSDVFGHDLRVRIVTMNTVAPRVATVDEWRAVKRFIADIRTGDRLLVGAAAEPRDIEIWAKLQSERGDRFIVVWAAPRQLLKELVSKQCGALISYREVRWMPMQLPNGNWSIRPVPIT